MRSDERDSDHELREQIDRTSAFLRRALRFWPSVLLTLLLGAMACAVFFHFRKPLYRSETVVLYSQNGAPGDSPEQSGARNVTVRLKELLMSRPKLERIIGEFDLYPEVRRELGTAEAVEELKKNIDYRAPGGDTFSVGFVGRSPNEAQRVTARLASLVIDQDAELRRNQARVARDFLVSEKAKTESGLRAAERELAAFMAKHPRFALDATPLATGAAIRATSAPLSSGRPASAPRMFVLPPAAQTPGAAARAGSVPVTVDADSELARANAAVAAARANLSEQQERFTPAHPDVRAAQSAVERAENRLAALSAAVPPARPAPPPAQAATEPQSERVAPAPRLAPTPAPRASEVAAGAAPAGPGDVVALETEWLKLTRAVTEARLRQDQVEAALFKADILASSESGGRGLQMTVIDPAFLPARPLPPGRMLLAAIFAAVSLVLGIFVALVRAVLDDRIFDARDIGPVELLVEVPRASTRRAHVPG
jgi:capsular polysaccharide biosynthesis protein